MTAQEVNERLQKTGDVEEMSLSLTLNEWAAVVVLLGIAMNAGCPATNVRPAFEKIVAAQRQFYQDEWADTITTTAP